MSGRRYLKLRSSSWLLEQVQAQTVGQGRVDVHGLLGDAALLVGLLEIKGAHVVQAVGQFDHQHAHVVAHGQDHLADVLGLRLFLVLEDDHADLGDTVHDVGHVFAELVVDLFDGGAGVFHRIVQQARRHRGLVKAHVGQGIGHGQRMGQIGLARKARLPRVSCGGEHIGLLDQLQIGIMVVGRHLVENFLNTNHSVLPDGKKLTIPVLSMFGQLSRLVNDDGPEGRDRRRKLPPARGGPMQASRLSAKEPRCRASLSPPVLSLLPPGSPGPVNSRRPPPKERPPDKHHGLSVQTGIS